MGTVQLMANAETVTEKINCNNEAEKFTDCLPSSIYISGSNRVAGLICNCTEGSLRLVDGSSYNEGRVEVCSNGRWGTVCNDGWTEREAALVCSRLGYPTLNATLSNFGEGSGPLCDITCPSTGSNDQECILIITSAPSRCNHLMDVGVRCLPFTDACAVSVNEIIVTVTAQQPPTPTLKPMSTIAKCILTSTEQDGNVNKIITNNKQPITVTETPQPNNGASTESSIKSTIVTLGALIGLLAVALVVVVTGWIGTCVYLQRKMNKKCKGHTHTASTSTSDPINNPVYNGSTIVPHTMYSSHGPSYEVIDTIEGVGHSYDVISRRGLSIPHPHTTPPAFNEEYSTLDTSRENYYHTLESNTGDSEYSTIGQSDPHNDRSDPRDYQGEEYSTLKH
ncbi:scavenger receptor cysteine-rich domain superfamily protein-like [Halichondria panicea]|uniref:scavenger receptor cysteine-rich domain superfamily protein-like n=1 Tax=Halichondria panicea TaxID=6063 RepID=UPI00312B9689